jgi:hypothetical protein
MRRERVRDSGGFNLCRADLVGSYRAGELAQFDNERHSSLEPHLVETLDLLSTRKAAPMKKALHVIGPLHGSDIGGLRPRAVLGVSQLTCKSLKIGSSESQPNLRIRLEIGEPGRMGPGNRDQVDAIALADRSDGMTAGLPSSPAGCHQDTLAREWPVSEQGTQECIKHPDAPPRTLAGNDVAPWLASRDPASLRHDQSLPLIASLNERHSASRVAAMLPVARSTSVVTHALHAWLERELPACSARRKNLGLMDVHPIAAAGFGSSADAYERGRPEYPSAAIRSLARRVGLRPGVTVVDLAAGTGKLSRPLAATGARVTAIEPVEAMRRAIGPGVETVEGTAEASRLPDGSADVVTVGLLFATVRPSALARSREAALAQMTTSIPKAWP